MKKVEMVMMTLPQGNGEGQGSWVPGLGDRKLSGVRGIVGASSVLGSVPRTPGRPRPGPEGA